ncbi:hypothetical protein L596_009595 [Steinernema carpocapsae]|uniref:RNA polymerase II subunit A C-terminal domain phosphatase n=1 Tax=Steinernema carpocapsae TaxID=34508 RepID=A0A4U5PGB5_STECR|nr:hypothetical protein L596_009595 [Steinernema carpocapsae]
MPPKRGPLKNKPTQCTHAIIIKDMCATCGKDLREKDGRSGQRTETGEASVAMIHHVPELHVSDELAKELGKKDLDNVLKQKKLILLVDLDQTIIHTSNQPYRGPKSNDIFDYTLQRVPYFTKIRPYTRKFLENINDKYQMHVVTYGQRQYAHLIAEQLDPEKKFFQHRILSRDELFHSLHKTKNLKALFPCGEELIAIIDDRRDVWEDMGNVVQVKPYKFFRDVGDINAPKGAAPTMSTTPTAEEAPAAPKEGENPSEDAKEEDPKAEEKREDAEPSTSAEAANGAPGAEGPQEPEDDDHVLQHVERVLLEAHARFYKAYEETKKVSDMKTIISDIRREVLCGECVVLSGIVPQGQNVHETAAYQQLIRFGADYQEEITHDTTLVIGARWGTTKIHMAHRNGIPVVTTAWLDKVVEEWRKPDINDFPLSKDSVSELPHKHKMKTSSLANLEMPNKDTMSSMADEVDEAMEDDDDEEDEETEEREAVAIADIPELREDPEDDSLQSLENETDKYSDEDSRDTGDEDFEPERKRRGDPEGEDEESFKRRRLNDEESDEEEFGDDGNHDEDDEDQFDEDDALAADLEQQFFS